MHFLTFLDYNASAYIFVVSAKDKETFPLAKQELNWAASHHNVNDYPLLVLVNRAGEEGAATLDEVKAALEVTKLEGMRWEIKVGCIHSRRLVLI